MAGTFDLTLRASYTVPASSDNNAIAAVDAALEAAFPGKSVLEASAVQSPIQSIPGQTTYDVTVTAVVSSPALDLPDSLGKVNFKSLGTAVLKAGHLTGSQEHAAE